MEIGAAFVADGEAPKAIAPCHGALHHPAVLAQAPARLGAAPGDPRHNAPRAAGSPADITPPPIASYSAWSTPTNSEDYLQE